MDMIDIEHAVPPEPVNDVQQEVKEYYGQVLQTSDDLKTNACTTSGAPPEHIRRALSKIHPTVLSKYYGCGLVVPTTLTGLRVLDLGCGAGRDCYLLSQLVGKNGSVVGVDMTQEQINIAHEFIPYHAEKFGYSNVTFLHGTIENLSELSLADNSFDVIISNCVINLCQDKASVFAEAFRVLKPGGEIYFSDVYSSCRIENSLRKDKILWGECLSGALYWNDFLSIVKKVGFTDPRLVEDSVITIKNRKLEKLIGHIDFYSATYRLWKLNLEPDCQDYGQAVIYKGTVELHPNSFPLDKHHTFVTGKVHLVCGNTYRMLSETRLKDHFTFIGDFTRHYGIFEGCGTGLPFSRKNASTDAASCSTGGCC